ncbi:MAG: ribokinase [Clostridiaceae bacterium]|nr:ribokinase [Clostridiaceae bacterium]
MKILNFGSLNIDYVYNVDHILVGGETLAATGRNVYPGGKGLNQSVAFARADADVWHAGAIGKEDGQILFDVLQISGVNTEFLLKLEGIPSGHTFIQVDKKGQNCILVHGGSNQEIKQSHVDETLKYFSTGDYLILQNEINDIDYLIKAGHEKGMKVVLNPSPIDDSIYSLPLDLVDFFLVNEIEAAQLVEGDSFEELLENFVLKYPHSHVVMTVGSQGSYYAHQKERAHFGIFDVPVVDTTAAGDTFTGYFISSFAEGLSPQQSLEIASAASSIAVSRAGASSSIPTIKEVEQFLAEQ